MVARQGGNGIPAAGCDDPAHREHHHIRIRRDREAELHQRGELSEKRILEYARDRKLEEVTVALSLLCSLPANVVERALTDREMTLILSKACRFDWETTMALLFLGAKDHQINARVLEEMKQQYARLDAKTPSQVLSFYQTRMVASAALADKRRLPQLRNV